MKKNWKKILIGAVALLLSVAVLLVIKNSVGKKSVESYLREDLSLRGPNGYASLSQTTSYEFVDKSALYCEMYDVSEEELNRQLNQKQHSIWDTFNDVFGTAWNCNIPSKVDHLSNGDTVTIHATLDYDALNNQLGVKHKIKGPETLTKTYKISDLQEPVKVNLFDSVSCVARFKDNQNRTWIWYGEDRLGDLTWGKSQNLKFKMWEDKDYSARGEKYLIGFDDEYMTAPLGEIYYNIPDNRYLSLQEATEQTHTITGDLDEALLEGFLIEPTEKTYKLKSSDYLKDPSKIKERNISNWVKDLKEEIDDEQEIVAGGYFGLKNPREQGDAPYANGIYFLVKPEDSEKLDAYVLPAVLYEPTTHSIDYLHDGDGEGIQKLSDQYKSFEAFQKALKEEGNYTFTEFETSQLKE